MHIILPMETLIFLLFHVAFHPLVDWVLSNCNFWIFKDFGPACGISPVCGIGLVCETNTRVPQTRPIPQTGPSCPTNWAKFGPVCGIWLGLTQFVSPCSDTSLPRNATLVQSRLHSSGLSLGLAFLSFSKATLRLLLFKRF